MLTTVLQEILQVNTPEGTVFIAFIGAGYTNKWDKPKYHMESTGWIYIISYLAACFVAGFLFALLLCSLGHPFVPECFWGAWASVGWWLGFLAVTLLLFLVFMGFR